MNTWKDLLAKEILEVLNKYNKQLKNALKKR